MFDDVSASRKSFSRQVVKLKGILAFIGVSNCAEPEEAPADESDAKIAMLSTTTMRFMIFSLWLELLVLRPKRISTPPSNLIQPVLCTSTDYFE